MAIGLVPFYAFGNGSLSSRLGIAGATSMAAAVWLWALDTWLPFPRPKARAKHRALIVPISRLVWMSALLASVGGLGFAGAFIADESSLQDVGKLRSFIELTAIVLGPTTTVVSAIMVIWRGRIKLTPWGVQGRYFVKDHHVRWDDMQRVAPDSDEDIDAVKIFWPGAKRPYRIPGADTVISTAAWINILTHYRDHPEDRAEIGTQASLVRLLNDSA